MNSTGARDLIKVLNTASQQASSRLSTGIVSPCSTCKNKRKVGEDGLPACPRRAWAATQLEAEKLGQADLYPSTFLLRHGRTKGSSYDDTTADYENPVQFEEQSIRVVWIALIEDNPPLTDLAGNLVNPELIDPSYDSKYLVCKTLPYIPGAREGAYYAGEQLRERDVILVNSVSVTVPNSKDDNSKAPIRIGGYVTKSTAPQQMTLTPAKKTVNAQGL